MNSLRPLKVALWLAVATMAFMIMASSSPQCARSTDYSVNPSFDTQADGNPCIAACVAELKAARNAERIAYKAAKAACNGDQACKDAAAAQHDLNQAEITADDAACKAACQHEQGTATGGQ